MGIACSYKRNISYLQRVYMIWFSFEVASIRARRLSSQIRKQWTRKYQKVKFQSNSHFGNSTPTPAITKTTTITGSAMSYIAANNCYSALRCAKFIKWLEEGDLFTSEIEGYNAFRIQFGNVAEAWVCIYLASYLSV